MTRVCVCMKLHALVAAEVLIERCRHFQTGSPIVLLPLLARSRMPLVPGTATSVPYAAPPRFADNCGPKEARP